MALEIGEITVNMAVGNLQPPPAGPRQDMDAAAIGAAQQARIVEECVRRVLLALQRQQER